MIFLFLIRGGFSGIFRNWGWWRAFKHIEASYRDRNSSYPFICPGAHIIWSMYFTFYRLDISFGLYPYKTLRARLYFRSAAAPSVAPPPLPVNLAACEGLAGGSEKFLEFSSFLFKNPWKFGNHPDLKIPGIFGITRIEVQAFRVGFTVPAQQ